MKNIILASASPRRKRLLKRLGLSFIVVPSKIEEKLNPRYKPRRQVEVLSLQKAESIVSKQKNAIIIAADTLVAFEGEVLGKTKDTREMKRILKKLSGNMHSVVTGFTIIDIVTNKRITKSIESKVWFRKLDDQEIARYIEVVNPSDFAGAYSIQGLGALFVEKIEGDYYGIVGLPINLLAKTLKKFGIVVL